MLLILPKKLTYKPAPSFSNVASTSLCRTAPAWREKIMGNDTLDVISTTSRRTKKLEKNCFYFSRFKDDFRLKCIKISYTWFGAWANCTVPTYPGRTFWPIGRKQIIWKPIAELEETHLSRQNWPWYIHYYDHIQLPSPCLKHVLTVVDKAMVDWTILILRGDHSLSRTVFTPGKQIIDKKEKVFKSTRG